jgi:hypothetical protein
MRRKKALAAIREYMGTAPVEGRADVTISGAAAQLRCRR